MGTFRARTGTWEEPVKFDAGNLPGMAGIRKTLEAAAKNRWAGFQVFYAMTEKDVRVSNGTDLIESMLAVFDEVTPLMNLCMQVELRRCR